MCSVEGVDMKVEDITEPFLKTFGVVVATGLSVQQEIWLNNHCRGLGLPLISVHPLGFRSVILLDLNEFTYQSDAKSDENASFTLSFPALAQVYDTKWSQLPALRRFNKVWLAFSAMERARNSCGEVTEDSAVETAHRLASEAGLKPDFIPEHLIREVVRHSGIETSGVSAVLGGMVGQEVVKVVSGTGAPICNVFCFDANTGCGAIERIGCAPKPTQHQQATDQSGEEVL
eukprot:c20276_g1_i2.p1 GENE.c20276_g1_i2~~c20276_g1_i2.p1  ORF type:complete len:231 (+),score=50.69 c20276_g1_i2:375-1067(+)